MQENTPKKLKFWQRRPWKIGAIVTAITGLFASSSLAFTLGDVNNWSTSVWKDLNSEQGLLTQFRKASAEFNAEMKNFTGMSEAVVAAVTGEGGQLIPEKTKENVEKKAAADSPLGAATSQGMAAAAGSAWAANNILSDSGQKFDAARLKVAISKAQESTTTAKKINETGLAVQSAQSSQDVLKGLAKQLGEQSKINDSQVQLLLSIASDLQKNKELGAATNNSLSEMAKHQYGERQKQIINENLQGISSAKSQYRNINSGL
jgi:hypothetical protein